MIEFVQVSKIYQGGQQALSHVNFKLNAGEMVFLTGHSGAGKSTLMKLVSGIERASSGSVLVNGYDLLQIKPKNMPYFRRRIGLIFQNCALLQEKTVFDNVALPLMIEGYSKYEIKRRVAAALDLVGLYGKEQHLPNMLSGGEQQRIGIARAVINKPSILLADEPTGNLDPLLSKSIMNLFKNFHDAGTTVMIATHDLNLIERMGYRQLCLSQGKMAPNSTRNKTPNLTRQPERCL
jgi:cell division transport system ATP-binding protein